MAQAGDIVGRQPGSGYRLEQRIAVGGTGEVWRATVLTAVNNLHRGGEVAVKLMHGVELSAVAAELNLLSKVTSNYIPRYYDVFSSGGGVVLVMQLIEGLSLDQVLAKAKASGRSLEERYVVLTMLSLLATLQDIHAHVIHRDIKPANVRYGLDGMLYLLDFGIAKHANTMTRTSGAGFGTHGFAAPEQHSIRTGATNARTDVYGVAALAYALLTGDAPPDALSERMAELAQGDPDPLVDIARRVPLSPGVAATIMAGLELRQSSRPTVEQMIAGLQGKQWQVVSPASVPVFAVQSRAAQIESELEPLRHNQSRQWDHSRGTDIERLELEYRGITGHIPPIDPAVVTSLKRLLQGYSLQKGNFGLSADPSIAIAIEDITAWLERIQSAPSAQTGPARTAQTGPTQRISSNLPLSPQQIENIASQKRLIVIIRNRITVSIGQKQDLGLFTPPYVVTDIQRGQADIKNMQEYLAGFGEAMPDKPVDFA